MIYTSLMANLNLGQSNRDVLQVAHDLATRLGASVMGTAGGHPREMVYADGYASADVSALESIEISRLMAEAKAEFQAVFGGEGKNLGWRATEQFESVGEFVARESRCVDLVITGAPCSDFLEPSRSVDTADLIMRAGRPVLVVPSGVVPPRLDWVLVAWKDTREARRAIVDALPLLKLASHVAVVEITDVDELDPAQSRLDDVLAWLKRHGVAAEVLVIASNRDDPDQLGTLATERGADLLVAGAYGHSRLREWVLGGVTRSLLLEAQRCSLFSH